MSGSNLGGSLVSVRRVFPALVAAFALAFPGAVAADHAIGGVGSPYHWASPRQVSIYDGVETGQGSYNFSGVVSDWNTAAGGVLTLTNTGSTRANITTQRRSYGNNGWLGLAQFYLTNGHFSRVAVKLNDFYAPYYPQYYTPDAMQQTLCQEVGHGLGLDHQLADSCMNDQNVPPTNYPHPNGHDAEELGLIYAHTDPTGGKPHGPNARPHESGPFTLDVIPAPGHGHPGR
jgi:hypothetical protein